MMRFLEFIIVVIFFGRCTAFLLSSTHLRVDRLENFLLSAQLAGENQSVLAMLYDCPGLGMMDLDGDGEADGPINMSKNGIEEVDQFQNDPEIDGDSDGRKNKKLDEGGDRPMSKEEKRAAAASDEASVNLHFAMHLYYASPCASRATSAATCPAIIVSFGLSCLASVVPAAVGAGVVLVAATL